MKTIANKNINFAIVQNTRKIVSNNFIENNNNQIFNKKFKNCKIIIEKFVSKKTFDKNKNVKTHDKSKNLFRSRNRTKFFITLIEFNKSNNQTNHFIVSTIISQIQTFVHSFSILFTIVVHFDDLFKIEKQILNEFNILIRRYYMIFLNNKMMTKFVRKFFFEMKFNHKTFKFLIFRVKKMHKN